MSGIDFLALVNRPIDFVLKNQVLNTFTIVSMSKRGDSHRHPVWGDLYACQITWEKPSPIPPLCDTSWDMDEKGLNDLLKTGTAVNPMLAEMCFKLRPMTGLGN